MLAWRRRHPVSEADLSALVDGALSPPRRAAVEAHVQRCGRCAAFAADLRDLKAAVAALPRVAAPRSFALRPQAASSPVTRSVSRYALAPALSLAILVLLVAVDLGRSGPTSTSSGSSVGFRAEKSIGAPSDQAAVPPSGGAAGIAPSPAALAPARAAPGEGVPPLTTAAAAQADAAKAAAAPSASPQSPEKRSLGRDQGGSHPSVLRVLEVLAALAFVGSLSLALRTGTRPAGH